MMLPELECPKCGNSELFEVSAHVTLTVKFTEGRMSSDAPTQANFPDLGHCECLSCHHRGSTIGFRPLTVGSCWFEPRKYEDSSCLAGTIVEVTDTHVMWSLNLNGEIIPVEIAKFRRGYHSPSYPTAPRTP